MQETIAPKEVSIENFDALYEFYFPRVYNFIFARVKELSTADEIISVVFEKVFLHLDRYDARKGAFSTWVFRIATNEIASYFRRGSVRREVAWSETLEVADERGTPEREALAAECREELLRALDELSERSRRIFLLKHWSGLSNQEIAAIEGISESNTGVILHRTVLQLREILKKTKV